MKKYEVKLYQKGDFENWNRFVSDAKNATFLFDRNFMEYHKDRFQDYSLIVLDKEKWVAILPANRVGDLVYSHLGLTYGGLVYSEKIKLASIIEIFKSILIFLNENKIEKLHLKTIPSIYHQKPAEELNYALFLAEALLVRRDSLSVLDLTKNNKIASGRKEGVAKGNKNKLEVREIDDFDLFWMEVLMPNLGQKHKVKPVHSLEEITRLKKMFPENIRQFNVYQNGIIVAGTTIFESKNVVHSQYISGNGNINDLGSVDFLYNNLITTVFKNKRFLDFGTSNENQGRILNNGLSYWKESFGASTIVHDFYEVKTSNYSLLDSVIL